MEMVDVILVRIPARDLVATTVVVMMMMLFVPAAPTKVEGCVNELTALSPCLPFVSSPPNNLSSSPSPLCCDAFSSAFNTTTTTGAAAAACYCYLLHQPSLLGFPLNTTSFLSLSSFCSSNNNSTTEEPLEDLCEASPTLPPLQFTTDSENSSAPFINLPPESDASSPTPPTPGVRADSPKMMSANISGPLLPPGILLFLVPIFTSMWYLIHQISFINSLVPWTQIESNLSVAVDQGSGHQTS